MKRPRLIGAAAIVLAGVVGCDEPQMDTPLPASTATVARPETDVARVPAVTESPKASAEAPAGPSEARRHPWLGIDIDDSVRFDGEASFGDATIQLPPDFRTIGLGNGMSDGTVATMAFIPSATGAAPYMGTAKSAIIILTSHGAVHDSLLDYGASKSLGISAGVSDERWEPGVSVTVGAKSRPASLLRGTGSLLGRPSELWQLRCEYRNGSVTMLLLGVLDSAASADTRKAFLAAYGSFEPGE